MTLLMNLEILYHPHHPNYYLGKIALLKKVCNTHSQVMGHDLLIQFLKYMHHPITTENLGFFTVIYGEVGCFQYSCQRVIFDILMGVLAQRQCRSIPKVHVSFSECI